MKTESVARAEERLDDLDDDELLERSARSGWVLLERASQRVLRDGSALKRTKRAAMADRREALIAIDALDRRAALRRRAAAPKQMHLRDAEIS